MSETLTQERLEELADPATCLPSFAELRSIISELQSARSRIAALKGALEAFASVRWPDDFPDDQPGNTSLVTVGEYRRARSALSPNDALNTRGE